MLTKQQRMRGVHVRNDDNATEYHFATDEVDLTNAEDRLAMEPMSYEEFEQLLVEDCSNDSGSKPIFDVYEWLWARHQNDYQLMGLQELSFYLERDGFFLPPEGVEPLVQAQVVEEEPEPQLDFIMPAGAFREKVNPFDRRKIQGRKDWTRDKKVKMKNDVPRITITYRVPVFWEQKIFFKRRKESHDSHHRSPYRAERKAVQCIKAR